MWIGTPDCPDNCGCTGGTGALAALRAVFAIARGLFRSL